MRIIVPKDKHTIGGDVIQKLPVFFLAGPIRGSSDWQALMCDALLAHMQSDFVVACPRRWKKEEHRLGQYFAEPRRKTFDRQLAWEQWYLFMAGQNPGVNGCVIFWLGVQDEPRPTEDGPYAMDTRREVGKWTVIQAHMGGRVVWGADPAFLGLSQIQRDLEFEHKGEVPMYESIDTTARMAAHLYGGAR